jgi:hypothetical protein
VDSCMELRHTLFTHVRAGKDRDTARRIKVTRGTAAVGLRTARAFDRGGFELSPSQTDCQCAPNSAEPLMFTRRSTSRHPGLTIGYL